MATMVIFGVIALLGIGLVVSQIETLRDFLRRPRPPTGPH